ncbi:uncharacterized protein LOC123589616 isoform X1 [Leopardus geoffroyi]|uniref:uncharacterized protein LOC123589616 isoform X1 n=1 Tax=Leopardus geoffroyi TaxID=46844 RepID=UPI001E26282A|nr:uncharacterized protein LOC123589616 isoform X1 [Leopardus geoffroyi]
MQLDKERRQGDVGELPPPGPRLQGDSRECPKLAFGCDRLIQALPHPAGDLGQAPSSPCSFRLENEGNSLQHRVTVGGPRCQVGRTVTGAMGTPELPPPSLAPPWPGPPGVGGGSIHGLVQAAVPDCSLQTPPWDAKSVGPVDSAPKPVRPVVWEEGAPGRSFRRYRRQALQSPGRQHSGSSGTLQTDGRSDTWPGHGARWGTVSAAGATVAAVDLPPAGDRPGAHQLRAPALQPHPGRDTHPVYLHAGAAKGPVQSPQHLRLGHHLAGGGPQQRVKFLVMSDRGPVAETEWSSETHLQEAKALQAVPGPQSAGTVVIIAILSVLLAVLFTALLALLIYTCHDTRRSAPISGPEQSTCVRRYNTHHVTDPPAVGAS